MSKPLKIVGIGDSGCLSLSSVGHNAIASSTTLIGGERHLQFFTDYPGKKIAIKGNLSSLVSIISDSMASENICLLASGDPLFFGIGSYLVKKIGIENIEIIPHPSSMQEALAKLGVAYQDIQVISFHGRKLFGLCSRIRQSDKIALFTDEKNNPGVIAKHLIKFHQTDFKATVLENISGADEKIRTFDIEELSNRDDFSPLNILYLERPLKNNSMAQLGFLDEELFAKKMPKKGLITKKEIRALTIASLKISPKDTIWDIGAGSGSVAIEASFLANFGTVIGVECDEKCQQYFKENIKNLSADNIIAIDGKAPEILKEIEYDPDAIFIGGSKGNLNKIVSYCYDRLRPSGRMVVNAVTLENVIEAKKSLDDLPGKYELMMVNISRGKELAGKYLRYEAQNPIHIFTYTKN